MTRLAMILGLVVLFGLGYAGIERIGLADARIHSVRAARAHAHLAAVIGEMEWAATVEQLRGIAQSAGAELSREWSAGTELDPATLKRRLEVVLDRAGGRGSVAVFSADRRRLASVTPPGSAELDPTVRPVEDARAGAATVQLVGGAAAPTVVAAAPIGSGRVLAVSVVFDRRLIDPWVQAEGPAGDLAIVGPAGEPPSRPASPRGSSAGPSTSRSRAGPTRRPRGPSTTTPAPRARSWASAPTTSC
jgi:hypothetical protein